LLRDVICGHLPPDLIAFADELLAREAAEARELARTLEGEGEAQAEGEVREEGDAQPSAEQMLGDAGQAEEVLDLYI